MSTNAGLTPAASTAAFAGAPAADEPEGTVLPGLAVEGDVGLAVEGDVDGLGTVLGDPPVDQTA